MEDKHIKGLRNLWTVADSFARGWFGARLGELPPEAAQPSAPIAPTMAGTSLPIALRLYADMDGIAEMPSIPPGQRGYLIYKAFIGTQATRLVLLNPRPKSDPFGLHRLYVSWKSNGIRDENMVSKAPMPAACFTPSRKVSYEISPTDAEQRTVITIENRGRRCHAVEGYVDWIPYARSGY